jgi:hypothetical protein
MTWFNSSSVAVLKKVNSSSLINNKVCLIKSVTIVLFSSRFFNFRCLFLEKQIIDYLNQIKHQGKFLEKLRRLKYLKDHFLIEGETDIKQILTKKNQTDQETSLICLVSQYYFPWFVVVHISYILGH